MQGIWINGRTIPNKQTCLGLIPIGRRAHTLAYTHQEVGPADEVHDAEHAHHHPLLLVAQHVPLLHRRAQRLGGLGGAAPRAGRVERQHAVHRLPGRLEFGIG